MDQDEEKSLAPALRVLIVDNERDHAELISEALERVGYSCAVAASGPEGARRIEQEAYDIVITDLVMNEVGGMEILAKARQALPDCEVIMVTGHASIPKAVEAMQQGAANFLEKPLNIGRLRAVTDKAAESVRLRRQNLELAQRLDERFGFEGIIYVSKRMQAVVDRVRRIAPADVTVLITGEHGSGKELVAGAIHHNSPRKNKPFVPVNCGAIPKDLVESELFGHVKGAFTYAHADRVGKFEFANGGTLFLDEIGEMPLDTQVKLLRVLEERTVTRVGDNKPIPVNVRILSATNRNLEEAIAKGEFREDLYYRLKVVTVHLPGLAERKDDIVPLADHFRKEFARRHDKKVRGFTPAVMRRFFAYDWPGSVRELRSFVETMVVLDIDGLLDVDDLPPELADPQAEPEAPVQDGAPAGPHELIGQPLEKIERWAIEETLRLNSGNREETAKMLGIGSRTLYRKIKEYNL